MLKCSQIRSDKHLSESSYFFVIFLFSLNVGCRWYENRTRIILFCNGLGLFYTSYQLLIGDVSPIISVYVSI